MPEQVAPEGGQTITQTEVSPVAPSVGQPQPVVTGSTMPTPAPIPAAPTPEPIPPEGQPPSATPEPDRDTLKFSQRELDHIITQRLHEERQKVGKELTDFRAEVTPRLSKLEQLEQAQAQVDREAMTEAERLRAEVADRDRKLEQIDAELSTTKATLTEIGAMRRREQIDHAIDDASPNVLTTEQRDRIHRQFANAETVDPAQIAQAAQTARAEVEAQLRALGYAPTPTQIGSPGTPPAEPLPDKNAEVEELLTRAEAGDDQAAAALQKRLRLR